MGRGKLTPQDLEAMKAISANLQRLLAESGMKQSHLATILNIPTSSLNEYVKGKSLPKIGNIQKIADYFGLQKSDIDPRFASKKDSSTLDKINHIAKQLEMKRQIKVLDFCYQQSKEQKETVTIAADDKTSENTITSKSHHAEYQKIVDSYIAKELKDQTIIHWDNVIKAKDLYQTLGRQHENIQIYGEVSAGTGIWVGHEKQETIKYPIPIPEHDIALTVNGNSMEPLFYNGDVIFVKKTKAIHHGQIIVVIVNNEAYVKKLYRKNKEIRLISLNPDYDDIILKEDDTIEVIGTVIT
ncbi:XRE family transcriptional regulator [Streptococcus mutans]|uniref:XRE family transcriptional regulator n=1 Tax=Streptococcus mutans TaxID=1309 RepID=UPI000264EE90|nr:XRE family transcriptional regulator [Streptococcus mutans]EMB70755.1 putative transcriptional regulator [Streptococcus mutans 4VF1]EMC18846.1 putative transcriptional regulator [Streptococcus mutans NV1996]EMC31835.1 putative transcriptional regulator [Streptococcus mutans NLML1]MCB5097310.1 XRE family transcriptional regulator [Streptococcus mutans]MDO8138689.1 XRE family transcriptional regulator [Streptococcus mutans]